MPNMEGKPHVATAQEACPGPSAVLDIKDSLIHLLAQQLVGDPVNKGSPCSVSRRPNDMLSTPFNPYIINYNFPRWFMVPKFFTYDGTNDPFDHIMHYRQLMTLDIGNDALLCKVFQANLHG